MGIPMTVCALFAITFVNILYPVWSSEIGLKSIASSKLPFFFSGMISASRKEGGGSCPCRSSFPMATIAGTRMD
ncbi:hypothetical protein PR003_g1617 [Phytophthora rubi]|uniref:Uncharacterized protein n=1 Tax=Phytophthora rubi TaxID=129364 RepID=A0A6A3NYV0_9STRA|nr:hypothetical protein PR002_g1496 [Phytophthora rubi]KAE9051860.1 hypothetical protein PR001_g1026 [Phytophthora rubi]KAE9357787.1 hypothetical protein PR003_g1617 [Phytophthora rubi]